jgi:hypothetical protein
MKVVARGMNGKFSLRNAPSQTAPAAAPVTPPTQLVVPTPLPVQPPIIVQQTSEIQTSHTHKDLSGTTFVSAFVSIYPNSNPTTHPEKTLEKRIAYFEDIAKTGISICLYSCTVTKPLLIDMQSKYPNIKLMDFDYTNTETYKLCMSQTNTYPRQRDAAKDTLAYMALMNSKIVFMHHAISVNPWNSNTFAWIDFSIGYIFKNKDASLQKIVEISKIKLNDKYPLMIPGCWGGILEESAILENIHWRFCGGFFIGKIEAIEMFYYFYKIYFPIFMQKYNRTLWEVNFWAWLEFSSNWKPHWYGSNHNDSMLNVPTL